MNNEGFRLERLTAALLSRQTTLKRTLDAKDQTQTFDPNRGFVFYVRGAERRRIEEELASVEELLAAAMP